jgi:tRNA A-37 threonylcarbamoyl transferase component Bud32
MVFRRVWALPLVASALLGQQYPFVPVPNSPKNIERILQDKVGRLWMATHDDVVCFDGTRFFSLREFGFRAEISYGLAEDAEGGIWSGTNSGVYRFIHGRLEHVVPGLNAHEIIPLAPGLLAATAFVNSGSSLYRLYRIQFTKGIWRAEQLAGLEVRSHLTRDGEGNILAVCPGGWCELPVKMIADWNPRRPVAPLFHRSDLDIERVARDRYGCLWFRSLEGGAYQCPGDKAPIRLPVTVAGRNVWGGEVENEDGSMLFASVASLAVGRPGAFRMVTPANGLPAVSVSCAVRGRDGSIWVGSLSGLYRFPYPFRMEHWRSQHGLVWSFARAGDRLIAGTSAGVAYLDENRQWTVLKGSREFGSVSSVLTDAHGEIYAVVAREGIIQLSPNGSLVARTPPGQGGQATYLARTDDGQVWVAGGGIYRLRKRGHDLWLDPEDLPGDWSSAAGIAVDKRTGDLWACAEDGLIHREAGTWKRVTARGELPENPCISLVVQPNGDVWLGYPALSATTLIHTRLDLQDRVRHFQIGGDFASYFLGLDSRSWLWRGSGSGIYAADSAQAQKGEWLRLNETDGLTELDANHGSFFSDSDSSVWWAAAEEIVHFSPPEDLVHPAKPPPVFLSGFSVDGGVARLAESVKELPNGRKLMAHIGSLQFSRRDAIRIRYRLLPEQIKWQESRVLDLDLGSPAWGTHTLEVQSRFSMSEWSGTLGRYIVVMRPWWLSWQAALGFAGIGFGGAAAGVAWHRRLRAIANARLPDLEDWRLAALSPEYQWVGTTLDGRYEIVDLVARGGFAAVLKGRDLAHAARPCAVKIFRQEVIDRDWQAHRFQQEVLALEQVRHPSVVSIYGHGLTSEGTPFLVMEFIEGGTLRDLLDAGALSPGRAGSFLRQAAGALEQIHARGIYHRDLKPENLMIRTGSRSGEELVLIDFSIAIVKEPDQTIHGLSRAAGTIYYMAPEQAIGFALPASDIYSLAKILLEMLTGQRLSTLLPDAALDLPERVRELAGGLPVRFSEESIDLLGAALEFDPLRRPQDAQLFAEPIVRDLLLS